MIVLAHSSYLITLARAGYFELLHEIYRQVIVSREVYNPPCKVDSNGAESLESPLEVRTVCAGFGAVGERSVIHLASALTADLVLFDEERARRAAKNLGLTIAGSITIPVKEAQNSTEFPICVLRI